jgi:hypothetical protein
MELLVMKKKLMNFSMKKIVYGLLIVGAILAIYSMRADYWSFAQENVPVQEDARVSDGKPFVEDASTATQAMIDKIHSEATHLSNKLASSTKLSSKQYQKMQKHLGLARLELKRAIEIVRNARFCEQNFYLTHIIAPTN